VDHEQHEQQYDADAYADGAVGRLVHGRVAPEDPAAYSRTNQLTDADCFIEKRYA
jgi:hypothetical protein